jgi:hypothetical protein
MDSSGSGYGRVVSFSEHVINFSETSFYELTDNKQKFRPVSGLCFLKQKWAEAIIPTKLRRPITKSLFSVLSPQL